MDNLRQERLKSEANLERVKRKLAEVHRAKKRLELVSRREGVVMNLPQSEEVGKSWEKDQPTPFCVIASGPAARLVPVSPTDYDLVRDDLKYNKELPVTIRVHGLGSRNWHGRIGHMPGSEAKTIPLALSSKGGGPLAVKPGNNDSKELMPQSQVYLIGVDILDSDDTICPGVMAQVKIHCRYRSAAWWVWRTLSATFDLVLL